MGCTVIVSGSHQLRAQVGDVPAGKPPEQLHVYCMSKPTANFECFATHHFASTRCGACTGYHAPGTGGEQGQRHAGEVCSSFAEKACVAWWANPTRFQTVFVSVGTASRSFQTVLGTVRLTRSRTGVARAFPCGTASDWTALVLSHCYGVTARTVVTSCRLIQQPMGMVTRAPCQAGEQCTSKIHGKFRPCRDGCS
jgi:hypothetical protein